MNTDDFITIMKLGFVPADEGSKYMNPAVLTTSGIKDALDPKVAAGLLVAVMECLVDNIEEKNQIKFEKDLLKNFKSMTSERHEHVSKLKFDQEF